MTAPITPADLLHVWEIPSTRSNLPLRLEAHAGKVTTVVGANGAGKSELGTWLDRDGGTLTHRVSAHRQLWFMSAGSGITTQRYDQLTSAMTSWRQQPEARYVDHVGAERTDIVLFDLLSQMNVDNDARVTRFEEGASIDAVRDKFGSRPIEKLNAVLEAGGLLVRIAIGKHQNFTAVRVDSGAEYPITQMSDGEKSALLLAAEILAGQERSVQIIDEPERHLHRAISTQVIRAVIASRPDCHFILLTHELDLVTELTERSGQILVLTSARWSGQTASGWDLHRLEPDSQLSLEARTAILGGRRQLVFIEGKTGSVDLALYRALYQDRQFVITGGSAQVFRAVQGLRETGDHHWVEAQGIVDGDHRSSEEAEILRARFIASLPVAEVENLYYLDEIVETVAQAHLSSMDQDVAESLARARAEGLSILEKEAERLTKELALTALRRRMSERLPNEIDATKVEYTLTVDSPYPEILVEVQGHITAKRLSELVRLLPVRNTAFPSTVVRHLGFRSESHYRAFVRKHLQENPGLAEKVRTLINLPN